MNTTMNKKDQIENRIRKVRSYLDGEGLSGLVLLNVESSNRPNLRYLTGFDCSFGALAVGKSELLFLTDSRYIEAAGEELNPLRDSLNLTLEEVGGKRLRSIGERVHEAMADGAGEIAVDPRNISLDHFNQMEDLIDGLTGKRGPCAKIRWVKDQGEIDLQRRAAQLTDQGLERTLEDFRPGMTEEELALKVEFYMRKAGAEEVAFDSIVASGPKSAMPHAHPGDREIREGDLLLFDIGARYGGYCADMTRTVHVGEPEEDIKDLYRVVLDSHFAGLDALAAGEKGSAVDQAARDVIERAGYEDKFRHGLGHGVGLEVHEGPRLSQTGEARLEPGMVVTVEPGVYLPGRGGIRIEDMVVLTEEGPESLSGFPKEELLVL